MPESTDVHYRLGVVDFASTITITGGGAVSAAAVDLAGFTLVGLFTSSAFDGTTLTFTVSDALAGTYVTLQWDGSDYTVTTAASKYVALDPTKFAGVRYMKIVTGTSQTGDTVITLARAPVL